MDIEENVKRIISNIPKNITLVAVSKTKPLEDIKKVYDLGIRDFGENKVQDLVYKYDNLNKDIRWHFIGTLQRNKVKYLVDRAYLIHSLDSIKLLEQIEKEYSKNGKIANVLIEINIGKEESKSGILEENLSSLIQKVELCSSVKVKGLMAIIPKGDESINRNYFKKVKNIWDNLKLKDFKNITMEILSMGMTHDYKYAIEEGTTLIRVGEGIFGKRNVK